MPDKYQQEFETLLKDISKIYPPLEIVDPRTSHITIYYLNKQSQFYLPDIAKNVKSYVNLLKGNEFTVGGFDYFSEDKPRVLFLNVLYPKALKDFNRSLTEPLRKYYANDNDFPFHPHMTVARINIPESKKSFKASVFKLKSRLNKIIWTFPITEVVLYRVDSTKSPEYHKKLMTIRV